MNTNGPDLYEPENTLHKVPHRWFRIFLGVSIFAVAVVTCLIVFGRVLDYRPTNLRESTAAAADSLQQILMAGGIPADHIKRGEAQVRNEKNVTWNSYDFVVDLKDSLKSDAVKDLIRRGMPRVTLTEMEQDESGRKLRLALDQREFVVLELNEKPKDSDPAPECGEIAAGIRGFLLAQGIPEDVIKTTGPEARQDDGANWHCAHFEAVLPPNRSVEQMEAGLQSALASRAARVSTRLGIRGTTTLVVAFQDRVCAEVIFNRGNPDLANDANPPAKESDDAKLKMNNSIETRPAPKISTSADAGAQPQGESLRLGNPAQLPAEQKQVPVENPVIDKKHPRAAIIIDDGGPGGPPQDMILALDHNLTLSIMPDCVHTAEVAKKGKELGFQIMLHLPMQGTPKPEGLTPSMSAEQIAKITERGFAKVPEAVGVNNHMGSIFTAHEDADVRFVQYIKSRKNLFIIDSVTTGRSKLLAVARRMGVPSGSRDVFLDLDDHGGAASPERIRKQFKQMVATAKRRGQVIAIGHFRKNTAQILAEMLPELEKNGIQLVHVSELVH